jgi:glutathionylspermidine synthase
MNITPPFRATTPLPEKIWRQVRLEAIFRCCKWDVQSEDHCVLERYALVLSQSEWRKLSRMAEELTAEALAAEREMLFQPALQKKLQLPRKLLRHMEQGEHVRSVRVMRFDFHFTTQGWRISEVNADVPGGFIEASGFSRLMAQHISDSCPIADPAEVYAQAILSAAGPGGLVALVHATAYSDDRQVMQYLAERLRSLGMRTCLAGPGHLRWNHGRAEIAAAFAQGAPDLVVRFFPAEWLPNLDVNPAGYFHGQTALSNPATALLLQSKRFPLAWAEMKTDLSTWRKLLPITVDPEYFHRDLAKQEKEHWVLKPAMGRVGEDIGMTGVVPAKALERVFRRSRRYPTEWIAQQRFTAVAVETEEGDRYPCFGVYTVNGKAAGIYGRLASRPLIDQDAQDVAVLLEGHKDGQGGVQ